MAKQKTLPKETESPRTVQVREFADVVRCPHCGGYNGVQFETWVKLSGSERKMGRCKYCSQTFILNITPWIFQ